MSAVNVTRAHVLAAAIRVSVEHVGDAQAADTGFGPDRRPSIQTVRECIAMLTEPLLPTDPESRRAADDFARLALDGRGPFANFTRDIPA